LFFPSAAMVEGTLCPTEAHEELPTILPSKRRLGRTSEAVSKITIAPLSRAASLVWIVLPDMARSLPQARGVRDDLAGCDGLLIVRTRDGNSINSRSPTDVSFFAIIIRHFNHSPFSSQSIA
jgi:hypothetical protein